MFNGIVNVERFPDGRIRKVYGVMRTSVFESNFGTFTYRAAPDHTISFRPFSDNPSFGLFVFEKF